MISGTFSRLFDLAFKLLLFTSVSFRNTISRNILCKNNCTSKRIYMLYYAKGMSSQFPMQQVKIVFPSYYGELHCSAVCEMLCSGVRCTAMQRNVNEVQCITVQCGAVQCMPCRGKWVLAPLYFL